MDAKTENIDSAVTESREEHPLVGGRYRVVRPLGHGGMGEVHLVEDVKLDNKLFAIKMLPSILYANKRAYRQLKEEALVAMKLSHPNIVTLRAFEETGGNPFLVMDYVKGKSLDDCLADWGTLTPAETVKLLKPVAAALDYAHSQGVVHRDIKPGNVMVAEDGTPYVLDFGIAREIQETLTRVTGKMSSGTLLYMGPEQLNGDPPSPAQDVYSFAAMAYECIKGEPPFARGAIEDQIKNKTPEPLPAESPEDASITAGIMAGLAKTPEKRPATCAAVLEGAEPLGAATRPPQRHTPPPAPVDFKPASSPALKSLAAVIAVGLAVAIAGALLFGKKKVRTTEVWDTNATSFVSASPATSESDVVDVKVDAAVKYGNLERVGDADGFGSRKNALRQKYAKAEEYYKIKQWGKAKTAYEDFRKEFQDFAKDDKLRQEAREKKSSAETERASALGQSADSLAKARWDEAERIKSEADSLLSIKLFKNARDKYDFCKGQYAQSAEEAWTENNRRRNWRREGEEYAIDIAYGGDIKMKWCPKGEFYMGSPDWEVGRDSDEVRHKVTLTKGFWLGETEVTQGQWKTIMDGETIKDLARKALADDTEYLFSGEKKTYRDFVGRKKYDDPETLIGDIDDSIPVYFVSWNDAREFCKKLTERERSEGRIPDGYEYRLPTEAEWEYACRAGSPATLPNGEDIVIKGKYNAPALDSIAWYSGNSSVGFTGRGWDTSGWSEKQYPGGRAAPRKVKGKAANNWGFYDMIGNVWEWCYDSYGAYPSRAAEDPLNNFGGNVANRVGRGGSWCYYARCCRPAYRGGLEPGLRSFDRGFRVALAPVH